jgi:polyferredoxin
VRKKMERRGISGLLGVLLLLSWVMTAVVVILCGFEWIQYFMEHRSRNLPLYAALLSAWAAACLAMSVGFAVIGGRILGEDAAEEGADGGD